MKERTYCSPEPFHWEGSGQSRNTAVMLIHGFTGTPSEFRRLGYFLNDNGYTVNAICLPGHGTTPEEMLRTRWKDWFEHAVWAFDELRESYHKVLLVGHSMGGLLAFMLASKRKTDGIISLSAPFFLWSNKALLAYPLQFFKKYIRKKPELTSASSEEVITYGITPVACVASLHKLTHRVKRLLPDVAAPLLIGQGGKDRIVAPRSALFAYDKASSLEKEIILYKESSHSLLQDVERDKVYQDVLHFVKRVEKNHV